MNLTTESTEDTEMKTRIRSVCRLCVLCALCGKKSWKWAPLENHGYEIFVVNRGLLFLFFAFFFLIFQLFFERF